MTHPAARLTLSALLAAASAAALTGCGQNLVAPDSLVEGQGEEAFVDRVVEHCGNYALGTRTLGYVVNFGDDDIFLDLTSKLYHGRISRSAFADDLNGNYLGGNNGPAIDCIFAQLSAVSP
jgi:hypothetical protein